MENLTSQRKLCKGIQLVGIIILCAYFLTKNPLLSGLGITVGCSGELADNYLRYKETGKFDFMKLLLFGSIFVMGVYVLVTL